MMNNFTIFDSSKLIIQTNPTVTFRNGMTLWLAKPGETFEITECDWHLIQRIDNLANHLGRYQYPHKQDFGYSVVKQENATVWTKIKRMIHDFL